MTTELSDPLVHQSLRSRNAPPDDLARRTCYANKGTIGRRKSFATDQTHVRILVGMWPAGEVALSDAEIQRILGADLYVGSLGQAVEALALAGRPAEQVAA